MIRMSDRARFFAAARSEALRRDRRLRAKELAERTVYRLSGGPFDLREWEPIAVTTLIILALPLFVVPFIIAATTLEAATSDAYIAGEGQCHRL